MNCGVAWCVEFSCITVHHVTLRSGRHVLLPEGLNFQERLKTRYAQKSPQRRDGVHGEPAFMVAAP